MYTNIQYFRLWIRLQMIYIHDPDRCGDGTDYLEQVLELFV